MCVMCDLAFNVNFKSTNMVVFENVSTIEVCLETDRKCEEEFTVNIQNLMAAGNRSSAGIYIY